MELMPSSLSSPAIRETYRWQTHKDGKLRPSIMRTDHLFNTVIMLWHHFMPKEAALYEHRRWRFSSSVYSPGYIETSIRVMLPELAARDDLTNWQLRALKRMAQYLKENPKCLTQTKVLAGSAPTHQPQRRGT